MPGKNGDLFKPGDLVFAKMKGFPHWPARICSLEDGYKKRVTVYFFGTHQTGLIPLENVVSFVGNKMKYGSGVRIKGFTEGMWEIQNTPGIGSKVKVSSKSNTQSTPTKSSKLTPTGKAAAEKLKSAPTKSAHGEIAPITLDSKPAKTPKRGSLRSAAEKKETSEEASRPQEIQSTNASGLATVKKRGRPRKILSSDPPAPTGKSIGQTASSVTLETNEETTEDKTVSKVSVGKTSLHTENLGPKKTTSGDGTAEVETESPPLKLPTKATDSKPAPDKEDTTAAPAGAASTSPATTRRKTASKADAEQPKKKTRASSAAGTTACKNVMSASSETSQNDKGQKEPEEGEESKEKEEKVLPGNQGTKRKLEEKDRVKELRKKAKEKATDERSEDKQPAETQRMRRKKQQGESEEGKKDTMTQEKGEKSVKKRGRRRVEKAEQSEKKIKEGGNEGKREERMRRETRSESEGRKATGDKETQQRTRRDATEGKREERRGRKRKGEVKEEKEVLKKKKRDEGQKDEMKKTKEEKSQSKGTKKKTKDAGVNEESVREKKEDKRREGTSLDLERQRRLAAKRESVLKSLRGLLKSGKAVKRRDKMKIAQKAGEGGTKNVEARRTTTDKKSANDSNAKVIGRKPGVRAWTSKKMLSRKTREGLDSGDTSAAREEREKGRTEQDKRRDKTVSEAAAEVKDDKNKDDDAKQPKDEEKKDERKIIGKIVKAPAKQGAKVQVKTMMGGTATVSAAAEEKKRREEQVGEKKKTSERAKEKPDGRSAGVEGKRDRGRDKSAADVEKERKDEDKKERSGSEVSAAGGRRRRSDEEQEAKLHAETREEVTKSSEEETATEQMETTAAESPREEQTAETSTSKGDGDTKVQPEAKPERSSSTTLTDSTLHRIHGDIRISLKSDNPDVGKCLTALDQLSMVYVTSQHVQRHSELVATLRKMRFYRASQAIMDKASMLYNRFKNAFLVGEGEEVVSAAFLRSLLEEKELEENQRVERCKEKQEREEEEPHEATGGHEGEVKRPEGEEEGEEEVQGKEETTEVPVDSS